MIEEITSPPFLDDTAQEMVTKLQAIANNINNNAGQVSYSNTTSQLQAETVQTAIDEVKGITDTISSSLTQKTEWHLAVNEILGTGANYDETLNMTMPNYTPNEIMFVLMRNSNARTFASAICPWNQFVNGAIYSGGEFALYSGNMGSATSLYHVNAVCIYKPNNQCEIAVNSLSEGITVRVYVR